MKIMEPKVCTAQVIRYTIILLAVFTLLSNGSARAVFPEPTLPETAPKHEERTPHAPDAPQDSWNVEYVGHIGGITWAIAVQGNYAFVGEGPQLTILDISNPASPTVTGKTQPLPDIVGCIAFLSGYIYVADGQGGLRIIDVSDPSAPFEAGFYDTPGDADEVSVAGSFAYVADSSGLRIIDISDPSAPFEAGFYDTGYANDVAVSGSFAYVAVSSGLRIIDISDPSAPFEAGFYDTPDYAMGVTIASNYAYVADRDAGLRIIDISDPSAPFEAGFYDTPNYAWGVTLDGSYAYVADWYAGVRIIDISDPSVPFEAGFYDTPDSAYEVAIAGSYAYVADHGALRIIDISNPSAPFEAGFYYQPGNA
jgi:hypothetical protein